MSESAFLTQLVADIELELDDDDIVCLYLFGWFLNRHRPELDDEAIERLCHQAYVEIARRREVRLVWVDWPAVASASARAAEPGTPLDFQVDAAGRVTSPLQALVERR